MPTPTRFAALSLAVLLCLIPAQAVNAAPPVKQTPKAAEIAKNAPPAIKTYITVNGLAIPQSTVDAFIAEQKATGADTTKPEFQAAVREEMIRRGALISEAQKLGLDKKPEYRQQIEAASQMLLIRYAVTEHLGNNPVSDAELQSVYSTFIAKLGDSEYKLRHIQLASEANARDIIAKLGDGKKFDQLAQASTDERTKASGGDLGWTSPATLPGAAASTVQPLKKGEFTRTPVQLGTSWHVFYVEDIRPLTPPKLDEIKPRLMQIIIQAKTAQYIEGLKAQAQVE